MIQYFVIFKSRYGDFPAFGGNGPDPEMLKGPSAKDYLEVKTISCRRAL
jgi:hypothetical protein